MLLALSSARLFVPVVAVLEEATAGPDGLQQEKTSTMATVVVDSAEHGRALLAFSGIQTMQTWRPDARPVAVLTPLAARAAVGDDADALVVDVAGPTPFALAGTELMLMASLAEPPAHSGVDPVLARAVGAVVTVAASSHPAMEFGFEAGVDAGVDARVEAGPVEVWVAGLADEGARVDLLDRLSRARAVAALAPRGLRVAFRDTP